MNPLQDQQGFTSALRWAELQLVTLTGERQQGQCDVSVLRVWTLHWGNLNQHEWTLTPHWCSFTEVKLTQTETLFCVNSCETAADTLSLVINQLIDTFSYFFFFFFFYRFILFGTNNIYILVEMPNNSGRIWVYNDMTVTSVRRTNTAQNNDK